jgi:ubiquinone/menaquinone biosynthesis C-methylase UbiE
MAKTKGHRWFAAMFDRMMGPAEKSFMKDAREYAAGGAKGRVLEIGCGTGANFAYYTEAATEVVATEPDPYMLERANAKAGDATRPLTIKQAGAEDLPFEDESFDTVVDTINMCTIGDLPRGLAEMKRVLKPGGELRFYEHVRYKNPIGALAQDVAAPVWGWFGAGCHPNRNVARSIREAGFDITQLKRYAPLPMLPPMCLSRPHIKGVAVRR